MNTLIAKDVFRLPEMNARLLSTSALLLALDVILYKIAIGPAYFQITFGFLSMALMGYLYGPIWAGLLEMLSNTLNFTIFGSGTFQAAFLITAFLGGFINGLFLYHKKINLPSVIAAQLLIMIPVSLFINSWLMSVLFGADFKVIFLGRFIRNMIQIRQISIFFFDRIILQIRLRHDSAHLKHRISWIRHKDRISRIAEHHTNMCHTLL